MKPLIPSMPNCHWQERLRGNPRDSIRFSLAPRNTFSDTFSFDTEAILLAGNGDIGNPKYYSGKFEAYQRTYVLSEFEDISPIFLTEFLDYRLKRIIARERQDNAMSYIKMTTLTSIKVPVISDELQEYCVRVFSALSEENIQSSGHHPQKTKARADAAIAHRQATRAGKGIII